MINGGHQSGLKQIGSGARNRRADNHQPDQLCKGLIADKVLHWVPAQVDFARLHLDDFCAPPVGYIPTFRHVAYIVPSSDILMISSSQYPRSRKMSALC